MNRRLNCAIAIGCLSGAVLLAGCSGPGAARAVPTAAPVTSGGAAPAAQGTPAAGVGTGQKAPGAYTPNGSADASSGRVSAEMLDAMRYQPNTFTGVKPGASVTVQFHNAGAVVHDFLSPALGVNTAVVVQPDQTGSVTFTAPSAPGQYQFWCDQPGHAAAGMVGEVVVQ